MDGFYNYDNEVSGYDAMKQDQSGVKQAIINGIEAKKREIQGVAEGLTEPLIVDGARGLTKFGYNKITDKAGKTTKALLEQAESIQKDYQEGGIEQVLKNAKNKISSKAIQTAQDLKTQAETKARQTISDARGQLSRIVKPESTEELLKEDPFSSPKSLGTLRDKLGDLSEQVNKAPTKLGKTQTQEGSAEDLINSVKSKLDNPFVSSNMDDDIVRTLGANPSVRDIQTAQVKQDTRDAINQLRKGKGKGKALDLTDDMTNAQRQGTKVKLPSVEDLEGSKLQAVKDSKASLKQQYKGLSQEDKASFKSDLKESRENPIRNQIKNNLSEIEQKEMENKLEVRTMNKYTQNPNAQTNNPAENPKPQPQPQEEKEPSDELDEDTIEPKTDPVVDETGEDDIGKDIVKSVIRAGEIDAEGGGIEDPITDAISLVVGVGGLIGGIFGAEHKKASLPSLPLPPQSSIQIGVN